MDGKKLWEIDQQIRALVRAWNETDVETRGEVLSGLEFSLQHLQVTQTTFTADILVMFLDDVELGFDAALALARLKDERALKHLSRLNDISDLSKFYGAIQALGELGSERAVEYLLRTLDNPKQCAAIKSLEAKKAQMESRMVRNAIATALGEAGGVKVVPPLIELLVDEEDTVRWSAVEALKRVGAVAVDSLLTALETAGNEDAQWAILWALNKIDDPRAQAAVQAALAEHRLEISDLPKSQ